jgi:peptidoglycan/LPS O-acetylase OafA/YrhL
LKTLRTSRVRGPIPGKITGSFVVFYRLHDMKFGDSNRLEHLDGLRGLAALYVVVYHANQAFNTTAFVDGIPSGLRRALGLINFGQAAVAVFIVLSGYCLMLPVVKAADGGLRGGLIEYFKRRARRILPPYYAALSVSLLLIAFAPGMNRAHLGWGRSLPAFDSDILLSHLLLVHNLNSNWAFKIDYPMWSVATEWQIYFCFPLLLLPLWRRFGAVTVVGAAVLAGILPHWLFKGQVDVAAFEFIGLFAFGMAAAEFSFTDRGIRTINARSYGITCLALLFPIALFAKYQANWDWRHSAGSNIVVGLAASCLLVYCAKSLLTFERESPPVVVRVLRSKPCVLLGSFSYSLYLIHAPIIAVAALVLVHLHAAPTLKFACAMLASVSLAIVSAYVFFLAFERPFLVKRRKTAAVAQMVRDPVPSEASLG